MYPRSLLCEEGKIKQYTSSKKELCEIDEEAIWEFRFFFYVFNKVNVTLRILDMFSLQDSISYTIISRVKKKI